MTSAAVLWLCITAHLCDEQISVGAIAVAQGCCEPVLQSSTEQQGSYFALSSAAMHWCCISAHLYEEQISIGAIAVAQGCCEPVLQGSAEQQGSYFALSSAAMHWCCILCMSKQQGRHRTLAGCNRPDMMLAGVFTFWSSQPLWQSSLLCVGNSNGCVFG